MSEPRRQWQPYGCLADGAIRSIAYQRIMPGWNCAIRLYRPRPERVAIKTMRAVRVSTWLDEPSATVALDVMMASLPDGTDYPATVTLALPARQIQVTITNTGYQKLAP